MKVYKIRNKKTGLFSTGGSSPKWTNQGKVWQRINYVHSHLSCVRWPDTYNDCEIVEAEITEILTPIGTPNDYLIPKVEEQIKGYEEEVKRNPNRRYYPKWLEEARAYRAKMK